ncbi:hypothetical protein EDD68_13812 [Melghiribacillus thermohalophilus]|uniref:Uncharacterized protein n=1 Tax=Melghiribacillus thermohalophilus TaxID=1324956 RepID=A0A4V2V0B8_9BACI|nr:hypothetical protein EDD68_13812 [Melghiribacillus thermohalophilus]
MKGRRFVFQYWVENKKSKALNGALCLTQGEYEKVGFYIPYYQQKIFVLFNSWKIFNLTR